MCGGIGPTHADALRIMLARELQTVAHEKKFAGTPCNGQWCPEGD